MDYEKVLDDFIGKEREKSQTGSGDDMFYEQQIIDYINKQRHFWITFIKFIEDKINSETSPNSQKIQSAVKKCSHDYLRHNPEAERCICGGLRY